MELVDVAFGFESVPFFRMSLVVLLLISPEGFFAEAGRQGAGHESRYTTAVILNLKQKHPSLVLSFLIFFFCKRISYSTAAFLLDTFLQGIFLSMFA